MTHDMLTPKEGLMLPKNRQLMEGLCRAIRAVESNEKAGIDTSGGFVVFDAAPHLTTALGQDIPGPAGPSLPFGPRTRGSAR